MSIQVVNLAKAVFSKDQERSSDAKLVEYLVEYGVHETEAKALVAERRAQIEFELKVAA